MLLFRQKLSVRYAVYLVGWSHGCSAAQHCYILHLVYLYRYLLLLALSFLASRVHMYNGVVLSSVV